MQITAPLFAALFAALAVSAHSSPERVRLLDLRCEYLSAPLGVEAARPRLSWRMDASGRSGSRQVGYRVLISGSLSSLNRNRGQLWDSGFVHSGQSTFVEYAGTPLRSDQEVWWKVRVKDESGRLTAWSAPAHWTMGLIQDSDWKAKWIRMDGALADGQKAGDDPWFRKELGLPQAPSRALMRVASIGYHELYVNGQKVGDAVLEPAVSDYRNRARYVTYDIGSLLHKGRNEIGIWLGTGWSIYPEYKVTGRPSGPMVTAQASIYLPGGEETVVTDETWSARPSPNKLLGDFGDSTFGGEEFDAAKDDPAWCTAQADSSGWAPATVCDPHVRISAENLEPNRIVHELRPLGIEAKPDGSYRVDMGVNYVGWAQVAVTGQPGQRIDFHFSERPDKEETYGMHSVYIIGPSGHGIYRNRFNYSSGRWLTITGLTTPPTLDQIKGLQIRSDYQRAATFECSNPLLNNIYEATNWTFENLSLGGYVVDCPQRERRGYGGDAHSTTQAALDNYSMGAFYTKWSQDWRDVQGPDGSVPHTAPTYSGGGGVPWSGYCIHLPWKVYRQYGDLQILRKNFPTMQRWLAFMDTHAVDGLLVPWGTEWDFLGDWLWPYDDTSGVPNSNRPESLFFANCYWAYALDTASKIALAIGDRDSFEKYSSRVSRLRQAIHAKFYHPATHDYANGHQQYLAIALLAKVPPPSEERPVWKRLEEEILVHRQGHIDAGILGGALLTRLLIDSNRSDLLYAMATKDDYPSWGNFLKSGLTTIPESWDETNSLLHSSYIFIGAWFIEGVAGIRPGPDGGFQHFILRPMVEARPSLEHAAANYDSQFGRITCGWTWRNGHLDLNAVVPANTLATLYLPSDLGSPTALKSLSRVAGVTSVVTGDGEVAIRLQSGSYRLTF